MITIVMKHVLFSRGITLIISGILKISVLPSARIVMPQCHL